jgi:hypothetical protein
MRIFCALFTAFRAFGASFVAISWQLERNYARLSLTAGGQSCHDPHGKRQSHASWLIATNHESMKPSMTDSAPSPCLMRRNGEMF